MNPGRAKGRDMQASRLAGAEAASQKYDILTALGCHALTGPPGVQRLILRFITLITARYNWRTGRLHVGQREIARLWSVDERTVKREMAKLRTLGWVTLVSPARRGRVAIHALDLRSIRATTREAWPRIGEDFEARMAGTGSATAGGTVVQFPRPEAVPAQAEDDVPEPRPDDPWAEIRRALQLEDAVVFASWFEVIRSPGRAGETLILVSPNAFHASYLRTHYAERLASAARRTCGITDIRIMTATASPGSASLASLPERHRRDADHRFMEMQGHDPEEEANPGPAGEPGEIAPTPCGIGEWGKGKKRGCAEIGGPVGIGEITGGPAVGAPDRLESHCEEAAEQQDMREIAIGDDMCGRPERESEEKRMAGRSRKPGIGRVEAGGAAAAKGEGRGKAETAACEDEDERHDEIGHPALPWLGGPELDIGR